jgi:hypothetical protein
MKEMQQMDVFIFLIFIFSIYTNYQIFFLINFYIHRYAQMKQERKRINNINGSHSVLSSLILSPS